MTLYIANPCSSIKKTNVLLLGILSLFFNSYCFAAQIDSSSTQKEKAPPLYLGFSAGLNNQNGALGLNLEIPLANQLSISTGIGLGTWGFKYYGQTFLYFNKNKHRGSAISFGITRAQGPKELTINVSTTSGSEDAIISGTGATNGFLSFYNFFNMGKQKNKFYLQLGYSAKLNHPSYTLSPSNHYGYVSLSESGRKFVNALAPGGFIVGLGFYIATL
jgi:hypothetical protein